MEVLLLWYLSYDVHASTELQSSSRTSLSSSGRSSEYCWKNLELNKDSTADW